ncbi:Similar to patl1: Protein PAT1 homolog 1 (Danio rerio) [Cotesia congregata]|uniref:Similar to patl1: Protein PAT1 homolog 1 (Danio rerio) n=1 Tax=Cotesia congregata TaxID=51543 RepID=A0A8J2H776_COTCN|nr:Similar to patl1: Protein PAT1 homolog 1 (Danio rerio) [Cotesia congregata]
MADSFFGFDTSVPGAGLDDAIECPLDEDDIVEEDEYDALNDETFGSATDDDWEKNHEKLAQIAESTRLQKQLINHKNGIDVDIEGSFPHLVMDEKDGIVPRPGVWDSPSNFPVVPPNPSLSVALKNVCTVEELERGLRPPPGLVKPSTPQPTNINIVNNINTTTNQTPSAQQLPLPRPGGQFSLDYPMINDLTANLRANLLNNMPRFPPGLTMPGQHQHQHPVILPPNVRLPNAPLLPNTRPLAGNPAAAAAAAAAANLLRYPLPPHLMIPHNNQRQPMHGNFSVGNFPQAPPNLPRPNLPPNLPQFMRPEHPLMSAFPNNLPNHHPHHQQQQHIQQQQQNQLQLHLQHQQSNNQQRNHNRPTYQTNDQSSSNNHNQPFFKNNQNWNQNRNNQRYHHNNYNNYHNGLNENGEYDEYAGMMSNREKQWLINIQLMQHNTNQPYFDDYYFTVFCDRQNKKNNESPDNKDNKKQNKNGYRDRDNKDQSQHILTKVVYTPTQFENSLGKLQCGSVTAPRKIIDMDVVASSDPQQNQASQQKDMKKARQRLLEIERLYTVQLKLEDVNNPLALVAEQQALQQQQQQVDQEIEKPVKKTAPELINIMLTSILQLLKEDKLSSILSIRKGKALLLRFLPFLSVTEYTQQLGDFWVGFIRGLAVISRRDANILIRAETLYPNEDNASCSEWSSFIVTLADTIGSSPPSIAPCQPIPANTLNEHLQRIRGLTIERYAPLESLLTDANLSR